MRVKMEPKSLKAELKRIVDRMLKTRPRAEIKNKPYIKLLFLEIPLQRMGIALVSLENW